MEHEAMKWHENRREAFGSVVRLLDSDADWLVIGGRELSFLTAKYKGDSYTIVIRRSSSVDADNGAFLRRLLSENPNREAGR
jgi:hypothetical protein